MRSAPVGNVQTCMRNLACTRRFSMSTLQDPSLDEHLTPEHVRDVQPSALGCEDCLKIGGGWVHLRICTECGHVGCCDNSPNRHATKHFHTTQHPIIRSFEPDEEWGGAMWTSGTSSRWDGPRTPTAGT